MKKYMLLPFVLLLAFTQSTFAMNSEFQKPEDELDEDVYATPAEEDSGETIEDEATEAPIQSDTSTSSPVEQPSTTTPAATPPTNESITEVAPSTTPATTIETQNENEAQTTQQRAEQRATNRSDNDITESEQQEAREEAQQVTPVTSPSDGPSSDVVIEETSNFWLFAIIGGVILFIIIALLFQRLRKNNPYDR